MCGEKFLLRLFGLLCLGSPPHVRGKGEQKLLLYQPLRITPACAGKSECVPPDRYLYQDHPRMCGEKVLFMTGFCSCPGSPPHVRGKGCCCESWPEVSIWGSPPHVRGKAEYRCFQSPEGRITPAYAGKRPCLNTSMNLMKDHPRVCGEKTPSFRYPL